MRQFGGPKEEMELLATRVRVLNELHEPVRLSFGGGKRPPAGFLNVDIAWYEPFETHTGRETFVFPFADMPWPSVPDETVDFIFHEDCIEHLTQKQQVAFLAEAFRVMKKGAWHRVNTPCLLRSMKEHSSFEKGYAGVYHGEWEKWGHKAVLTRMGLEEMARMIGYSAVVFNGKNQSVSPHAFSGLDSRPGNDRDQILGNIFADMLK